MLNKLDTNKPAGIDGIHSIVMKNCAAYFSDFLAQIFQSSYNRGIVPLSWKSANITAVFRKQRVVLGEHYSDWKEVTSGVPQGSVIVPLLFVIFINDMPDVVNHILKLFADPILQN